MPKKRKGKRKVPKVKAKTNKAMKGRFKVTATGKLLRTKKGRRHILTKKTSKRKRSLANPALVSESYAPKYKKMMNGL